MIDIGFRMYTLYTIMGWYVTCEYCGAEDKYQHPPCGCLEKRRDKLANKLIGSTIVDCCIKEGEHYTFQYTKYGKDNEYFYTQTVLRNGWDEGTIFETFKEISADAYLTLSGRS